MVEQYSNQKLNQTHLTSSPCWSLGHFESFQIITNTVGNILTPTSFATGLIVSLELATKCRLARSKVYTSWNWVKIAKLASKNRVPVDTSGRSTRKCVGVCSSRLSRYILNTLDVLLVEGELGNFYEKPYIFSVTPGPVSSVWSTSILEVPLESIFMTWTLYIMWRMFFTFTVPEKPWKFK